MGLLDFFKSSKKQNQKSVQTSIGTFNYVEFDGTKNYKGIAESAIGNQIEVLFPINGTEISDYQIEYFKKIESNWSDIKEQFKTQHPQIDIENYRVTSLLIPDKNHEFYDMDAEIVIQKKSATISIILSDLRIEEIIEIG
jgi:hypothetical protein